MNKTIKSIATLFLFSFSLLSLPSCGNDKTPREPGQKHEEKKMAFEQSEYHLTIGSKEVKLTLLNVPEKYKSEVKFVSSDPTILTVSADGVVKPLALGKAFVSAKAGEQVASCKVFVENPQAYKLSLNVSMIELHAGETMDLELLEDGEPYKRSFKVQWISSDPESLTVDQNGKVTAIAFGAGSVEVRVLNGNEDNYAYCNFVVNDDEPLAEFDANYIVPPFPYLKYPVTKDEVIAAERNIFSANLPLRKLIGIEQKEDKTTLCYHLRDFLNHGPAVTMFGNVFYHLNPNTQKGEPYCTAYAWGVQNPDQVQVLGGLIKSIGYGHLIPIKITTPGTDLSMDAWRAINLKEKKSLLLYLKLNPENDNKPMGVMEWRLMDGDPYTFDE